MIDFIRDYVKIVHNPQAACMEVTFTGFISYDELVEAAEYEFKMIQHYKLKKCLINLREISIYPEGGQEYIKAVWFPEAIKSGIRATAFIVPDDLFGKMSMQEAHSYTLEAEVMNYDHFNDQDTAMKWLKSVTMAMSSI
jgi:hypothetical protein